MIIRRLFPLLRAILPGVLFLAARLGEKRLLASYGGSRIALAAEGILFALILFFWLRDPGRHDRNREPARLTLAGAGASLGLGLAVGLMSCVVSRLTDAAQAVPHSFLPVFVLCIISPVSEELVYRGFVLERSREVFSVPGSVVLSALLFAAAHETLIQAATAFAAGLAFGILAYKTETVRSSCLSHAAANTFIVLLSIIR